MNTLYACEFDTKQIQNW